MSDRAPRTYAEVVSTLDDIEHDLAERQNAFADAARDFHKLIRDYELRIAQTKVASTAKTETAKKDEAIIALAAAEPEDDGDRNLYAKLKDAEGNYEGAKAAIRVLEQRATIAMSRKKDFQREGDHIPPPRSRAPEPQWSEQVPA
jgi:hypothetical protein